MKLNWKPRSTQRVTSYQFVWSPPKGGGSLYTGKRHRSLDKAVADFTSERLLDNVGLGYIRIWYTTPTGRKMVVEEAIWPRGRTSIGRGLARDVGPTDA